MMAKITRKKVSNDACATTASHQGWFAAAACEIARLAGRPMTFLIASGLVVLWAMSGPIFGFSDTWQLVINTSTTIITFLMVFLIQNTQNRDTTALQIKLDELIFGLEGASNKIAGAESMSDDELEALHKRYQQRAETALESLTQRRSKRTNAEAA